MNNHITTHQQIRENINNLRNNLMNVNNIINPEVSAILTNITTIMNTIDSLYTNTINYIVLLRNQHHILDRLNIDSFVKSFRGLVLIFFGSNIFFPLKFPEIILIYLLLCIHYLFEKNHLTNLIHLDD